MSISATLTANRVTGVAGIGISVEGVVKSAMIKNNFIDGAAFGGIVMGEKSSAQFVTVENNRVANIAPRPNDVQSTVIGVRLMDASRGEIVNNVISAIGVQAPNQRCVGVQLVAATSTRVAGNRFSISDRRRGNAQTSAGVECFGAFDELNVANNSGAPERRRQSNRRCRGMVCRLDLRRADAGAKGSKDLRHFLPPSRTPRFYFPPIVFWRKQPGREAVSLQNNFLDSYGVAEAVLITVTGACSISDNRCLLRGGAAGSTRRRDERHRQRQPRARHPGKVTVALKLPDRESVHRARQHHDQRDRNQRRGLRRALGAVEYSGSSIFSAGIRKE